MIKSVISVILTLILICQVSYAQKQVWTAQSIDTYEIPTDSNGSLESINDWDLYKIKPTQMKYTYPDGSSKEEILSDWDLYKVKRIQP